MALRRGEAHLAGSHLFDPATAEYNLSYIREYLPGIPVKVITLVGRQQGLLVQKGNPKGVKSLHDLMRPDVRVYLTDYEHSTLGYILPNLFQRAGVDVRPARVGVDARKRQLAGADLM